MGFNSAFKGLMSSGI